MITALVATIGVLVLAHRRIRNLRRLLASAVHEASHDRLTGLPNRRAAQTHLSEHPVAMIGLLDLDDFKEINDRHGHHVGDHLLVTVAKALTKALGQDGTVYRLAGDEFLLLWHHRPTDPVREARTLLREAMQPVTFQKHTLQPAGSLGLALSGPHLTGTDLITAADSAMYEAKINDQHRDGNGNTPGGVHLYPHLNPPAPADRGIPDRRATRSSTNRPDTNGSAPASRTNQSHTEPG